MRIEISSASQFLVDLVRLNSAAATNKALSDAQLEKFKGHVSDILLRHYTDHWFPEKPFKGSGYRCIRINGKMDPLIARAGFMMGLAVSFLRSLFPSELTMWVDPREVSYRIGENGSICILYEGGEKMTKKGEEMSSATSSGGSTPSGESTNSITIKTPEKSSSPVVLVQTPPPHPPAVASPQQQHAPSPPPALPQHHQPPPQQVHHHHHHHPHQHHHHQQQHHFSPSKSVVVSSPLQQQLSRPMSPSITSQQNQQAAAAAMQLSMYLMNKENSSNSGLIKCKESLQRGGLDLGRPLPMMDRLFVSS